MRLETLGCPKECKDCEYAVFTTSVRRLENLGGPNECKDCEYAVFTTSAQKLRVESAQFLPKEIRPIFGMEATEPYTIIVTN
ncbi:hypothetical protein AVEN_259530-1 [Araneus ventricosus]|uniref:Uncharacterized protein n=1 Tax=Araneus ventricosus TaxID=182803 RepID=A0A4Y2NIU4_ARAVE|nr:hypothetical protein AVEN_259530-1 [Araneus ventricosus]